jgi:hypothetical protein
MYERSGQRKPEKTQKRQCEKIAVVSNREKTFRPLLDDLLKKEGKNKHLIPFASALLRSSYFIMQGHKMFALNEVWIFGGLFNK